MQRRIFVNEDDAHFTMCHPTEDMTVEGLQRLVDYYAEGTQVGVLLFCPNLQKALFNSLAWEPIYAGYDPEGGEDQPFLALLGEPYRTIIPGDHARNWVHNLWVLEQERGIDHFSVWLERCRYHGIEGWLTMRMNDVHGLQEYAQRLSGEGSYDGWALLCPSTFWKQHPKWRRAPYRWERSWEGAFDFGHVEVRAHHLRFIRELFERFDMDGLELDWLRWGMVFAPGYEQAGRDALTAFMREVRQLADMSAQRVGHPVKVGVRVPAEPQNCLACGFDVLAWSRERLIDQVVLSEMGDVANFTFPIELWRSFLGDGIRLVCHCEGKLTPYPGFGKPVGHEEYYNGCAASLLHRGADGVYLFNECYYESGDPARLSQRLQRLGSLETLDDHPRRHVVTYPQNYAAGDPARTVLPIPLRQACPGTDFGRMEDNISVRIHTGPQPQHGQAVLHLGFSPDTPALPAHALTVRLNGQVLTAYTEASVLSGIEYGETDQVCDRGRIGQFLRYAIPVELLQADTNLVEFVPPPIDGELRWVEIAVTP
jgi:hypothetical protein